MTTTYGRPLRAELRHEVQALGGNWFWFVLIGILLVVVGFVALSSAVITSLATAVVVGVLLLVAGVTETTAAFWTRAWSGFFLHLVSGILAIVVGVMFLRAPVGALLALTLLVASLLLVEGVFRIVAAMTYRFAGWGWSLVSGLIDLLLGLMILFRWPASALWVIGLFVGISFIFHGANWIALGMALRRFSGPATA